LGPRFEHAAVQEGDSWTLKLKFLKQVVSSYHEQRGRQTHYSE